MGVVRGVLGKPGNVQSPSENLAYAVGVAGGSALMGVIGSAKYAIGRSIVDRVVEGREFSEIEDKNINKRK